MAIRLASYAGDGDDLAALIVRVWRGSFAGRSWFPLWDRDFIAWRILDPRLYDPELIVCAYDGEQLVGCVIGEMTEMRIEGSVVPSALASYLSVDPEVRVRGLGIRMLGELERRLRARRMQVAFGVTSDAAGAPAKRFWDGMQRMQPASLTYLARYCCWIAVVRPRAVARAGFTRFDRLAPYASALVPWRWIAFGGGARAYRADDLDACRVLLDRADADAQVAMRWSAARLAVQLDHAQAHTLVSNGPNGLKGFATGYLIDWLGAKGRVVRVGFVELCVGNALGVRAGLLVALARRLADAGAQMVVMMDGGTAPRGALLLAGFAPTDPHVRALALFDTGTDLSRVRRIAWAFT